MLFVSTSKPSGAVSSHDREISTYFLPIRFVFEWHGDTYLVSNNQDNRTAKRRYSVLAVQRTYS
jgi:hypothetical protein